MKIGILITHLSEVTIIDAILGNHNFVIYRNQIDQYAVQTTKQHFIWVVEQGYNRLVEQDVDYIIASPASELALRGREKLVPLFLSYIHQSIGQSMIGKIGFVGDIVTSDLLHDIRPTLNKSLMISERQKKHRNFNPNRPMWFAQTHHWASWLDDYSPRSRMINNLIKYDLHQLKDAGVDILFVTDWSYLLIHKSLIHHSKQIKYQAKKIVNELIVGLNFSEGSTRSGDIYINGSQHLINKPKRKHWCKLNKISIKERVF